MRKGNRILSGLLALVMAAVSAALILTAEIWEISLAIFSVIFSADSVISLGIFSEVEAVDVQEAITVQCVEPM